MAQRLVITGASGYIGARFCALAHAQGYALVVLGRAPYGVPCTAHAWRLGAPTPPQALAGATAVVHFGHSWASDAATGDGADNINRTGTLALARAAADSGVANFVYVSSTSARAQARNAYGRVKYAIERQLREMTAGAMRRPIARVGLVYGGPEQGLYGLLSRLVRLTPVLPMLGLDREVQPIHVDDCCAGLLTLATAPPPQGDTFVLAGPVPVSFGAWLKTLRRGLAGKPLVLIPIPMPLALLACDVTRLLPFVPTVSRERVLGLAGAAPMDSAADLATLGLSPRDPVQSLAATPRARRRLLADAAAMLAYVGGRRPRSAGAVMRLTRAISGDPASRRALPGIGRRCPGLMRLFEPIRPSMRHGLSRRLHLAAMVDESLPGARQAPRPGLAAAAAQGALDVAALPLRLVLSRLCK